MKEPETELLIGGQALIEGVLMRSPGAYGIAVRKPDGTLALQRGKVTSIAKRWPILKQPILRGVAVLFQSLFLGIQALNFSALEAATEAPKDADKSEKPASKLAVAGSMVFGLGLGVVIFLLVPLWLTELAQKYLFGEMHSLAFNLFDGLLRGIFFLVYIVAISRMDDIHRVFQYHGAEHKVVFAWESGRGLTVDNARAQSRLHPRCGTSFLLFVLLVSIVLFALIPKTAPFLVKFGGRLVLAPDREKEHFARVPPPRGARTCLAADHHPGPHGRHAGSRDRRAPGGAARGRHAARAGSRHGGSPGAGLKNHVRQTVPDREDP
jgi:uncharacterized protein YqhQ